MILKDSQILVEISMKEFCTMMKIIDASGMDVGIEIKHVNLKGDH
jgi:hypothetical protein